MAEDTAGLGRWQYQRRAPKSSPLCKNSTSKNTQAAINDDFHQNYEDGHGVALKNLFSTRYRLRLTKIGVSLGETPNNAKMQKIIDCFSRESN